MPNGAARVSMPKDGRALQLAIAAHQRRATLTSASIAQDVGLNRSLVLRPPLLHCPL
eukprot:SAG11_NODE_19052_length_475_cov_0.946809_1_plen_56_part_10